MDNKKRIQSAIVHLFNKFPASSALGREDLVSRIKDYCETMGSTNAIDVEMACNRLAKTNSAFIPSAGQVYSAAQENAARRVERLTEALPRLPRYEMPEEQREDMKRRFNELVDKLKSGKLEPPTNGFTADELADENFIVNRLGSDRYTMRPNHPYGYMTKAEIAAGPVRPVVTRTIPASWLEVWEKQNNRQYYGLSEAAE